MHDDPYSARRVELRGCIRDTPFSGRTCPDGTLCAYFSGFHQVGGSAQDAELAEGGVVEFRTGRIAQSGPASTTSILDGWQLWLEQSGALEEGFPVGKGRVKVKHTDIFVSPEAPCEDHLQAAKTLVENHRVRRQPDYIMCSAEYYREAA